MLYFILNNISPNYEVSSCQDKEEEKKEESLAAFNNSEAFYINFRSPVILQNCKHSLILDYIIPANIKSLEE